LLETVASFANTEGGTIILGVEDNGNVRGFIYTIGNESSVEKHLFGLVKSHCEPMIDFTTEWVTLSNHRLLAIYVSEGKTNRIMSRIKACMSEKASVIFL
jgi:predicted HTH transcriptional regulator